MSDLVSRFETAQTDVTKLSYRPENDTLLRLYALYKQATEGDIQGSKPGFTDFKGRAKFEAWEKAKGMSKDEAMQAYVELVEELKG